MHYRLPISEGDICRTMAQSINKDGNEVLKKSPLALNVEIGYFFLVTPWNIENLVLCVTLKSAHITVPKNPLSSNKGGYHKKCPFYVTQSTRIGLTLVAHCDATGIIPKYLTPTGHRGVTRFDVPHTYPFSARAR